MKKISYCLMLMLVCISFNSYGQDLECGTRGATPDDIIYMPHYGNNQILEEISSILFPEGENKKTDDAKTFINYAGSAFTFQIPVKIWIYHDNDGTNAALSDDDARQLLQDVNQRFADNNTGIQFYLKCAIGHINFTNYNYPNEYGYNQMVDNHHESRALNWHLVKGDGTFFGKARFPGNSNNFRFAASFGGSLNTQGVIATIHEIGHTLGLLHTHENTNGWFNQYNGDADNCTQESVSRTMDQELYCINGAFQNKCDVNGDALCDTEAAPNKESQKNMQLDNNTDCNYIGGGTDIWGDPWDPPTRNYMSYVNKKICKIDFTSGQIAVMWNTIMGFMNEGGFHPELSGVSWYNRNHLTLSNGVFNGENDAIYSSQFITAQNPYTLFLGSQTTLKAQEAIVLNPGVEIKQGATFVATIESITNCHLIYDGQVIAYKSANAYASKQNIFDQKIGIAKELLREAYRKKGTWVKTNEDKWTVFNDSNLSDVNTDIPEITVAPNPFTQITTFTYNVKQEDSPVSLNIYSVTGEKITTLVQQQRVGAGTHQVEFDGSDLTAGTYLYRLEIGRIIKTGKIILKK